MRIKYRAYLKPFNNKVYYHDKIFTLDEPANIFYKLDKHLAGKGIAIRTIDYSRADHRHVLWIYCDVPYPWDIQNWIKLLLRRGEKILFCFEPPLINPFSHLKILRRLFSRVYTYNTDFQGLVGYHGFYIPKRSYSKILSQVDFDNKKLLTAVFSNKKAIWLFKLLSRKHRDLYPERMKAIGYFDRHLPANFDLYGRGWYGKKNTPKCYRGEVKDKQETIAKYKYCLVFENSEVSGYISEKIFDCFQAGSVPVYLGAPNVADYIPEDCYIDFRKFHNCAELQMYLEKLSKKEYRRLLANANGFINRKSTKALWFEQAFKKIIISEVKLNRKLA